jgi:hypothetical protein
MKNEFIPLANAGGVWVTEPQMPIIDWEAIYEMFGIK